MRWELGIQCVGQWSICIQGVVRVKHVSTYNSMIGGLALHRKSIEAVELFSEMLKERVRPNGITFVGVLNGCSHGWLVDMGGEIF